MLEGQYQTSQFSQLVKSSSAEKARIFLGPMNNKTPKNETKTQHLKNYAVFCVHLGKSFQGYEPSLANILGKPTV